MGFASNTFTDSNENNTIDVGVAFSNINSEDGSFTIADKLFSNEMIDGDVCLIFNAAAYNYDWVQYYEDIGDGTPGWCITDADSGEETFVSSFIIKDGDTLIFIPTDPELESSLTVAGQVADLKGASRVFICDPSSEDPDETMMPFSNPYPVATTLAMLEGFAVVDDVLLIWNDFAYNYDWVQYYDDTGDGTPGWCITDGDSGEETFVTDPTAVLIPACGGAVFIPAADGERVWNVTL